MKTALMKNLESFTDQAEQIRSIAKAIGIAVLEEDHHQQKKLTVSELAPLMMNIENISNSLSNDILDLQERLEK